MVEALKSQAVFPDRRYNMRTDQRCDLRRCLFNFPSVLPTAPTRLRYLLPHPPDVLHHSVHGDAHLSRKSAGSVRPVCTVSFFPFHPAHILCQVVRGNSFALHSASALSMLHLPCHRLQPTTLAARACSATSSNVARLVILAYRGPNGITSK